MQEKGENMPAQLGAGEILIPGKFPEEARSGKRQHDGAHHGGIKRPGQMPELMSFFLWAFRTASMIFGCVCSALRCASR